MNKHFTTEATESTKTESINKLTEVVIGCAIEVHGEGFLHNSVPFVLGGEDFVCRLKKL
jgi:hypothetical protein